MEENEPAIERRLRVYRSRIIPDYVCRSDSSAGGIEVRELIVKQAELYHRHGNSDKMYIITLSKPQGTAGYKVNARWGRRSSITPMGGGQTNTITSGATFEHARVIAQNLLTGKLDKGYTLRPNGITPTPYVETLVFVGLREPDRIGYRIDKVLSTEEVIDNHKDLPKTPVHGRRRKLIIARA